MNSYFTYKAFRGREKKYKCGVGWFVVVMGLVRYDDGELKEKVDYVSLLFRQIDRCNSSRGLAFIDAVEYLGVLVIPFEDMEYLERLKEIDKAYNEAIDEIGRPRFVKLDKEELEMKCAYMRAVEIYRAIIKLLDRKGIIIERLRVGRE